MSSGCLRLKTNVRPRKQPAGAHLEMSSGDLPDRARSARPVWLCKAENLNCSSVSTSRNRFTKPLHMLQTPSYSRTGLVSCANTALAIPGSFSASSASSRAADCCTIEVRIGVAGRCTAVTPPLARRGATWKPIPSEDRVAIVTSISETNPYNARRRSPGAERVRGVPWPLHGRAAVKSSTTDDQEV